LRLFSKADNQIAVFQIICVLILHTRKNDAKRYKFVAPKKNAKTHLFGQKHQEVPCFFKEVRFEKRAPLVISREFVNPFAKTGGKASILARPATSRLLSLFAARFLGTDAQTIGSEGTGRGQAGLLSAERVGFFEGAACLVLKLGRRSLVAKPLGD
jgi:hypothetical protein